METRTLDVTLNKQEIIERSNRQAHLVKEIEDKEAEKKETTARLGTEIKELTRELQEVAREVRSGKKWIEVEIVRTKDIKRGVEETVRTDTGEIINTRTLTPAEMQLDIIGGTSVTVSADNLKKSKKKQTN